MIIPEMPEAIPRESLDQFLRNLGLPTDAQVQTTNETVYVTVPRRGTNGQVMRANASDPAVITVGIKVT